MNVIVTDPKTQRKALQLAKGSYQRDILLGNQRLSGADLKGKAACFAGRYHRSRINLLQRMHDADLDFSIRTGPHNKKLLVLGRLY